MILFEIVLFGFGVQCKVWDHSEYGRFQTYFEITGGNKGFCFKNKVLAFLNHFNFGFRFYPLNGWGVEMRPVGKALDVYLFKWSWHKEWERQRAKDLSAKIDLGWRYGLKWWFLGLFGKEPPPIFGKGVYSGQGVQLKEFDKFEGLHPECREIAKLLGISAGKSMGVIRGEIPTKELK